ncbi:MAG: hypothetical protein WAN04_11560 [Candidatus Udaeobacter sp.]
MPRAFAYACLFALGSCSLTSPSGSRRVATASDAYEQRVLEVVDRAVDPATDKLPQYIGARVHFSFRIDPAGHLSRVRVFAERASDRPVAQIVAQAIRAAQFPSPPPKVMAEQGHRWYDLPELVYLVGAD